jgi:hypothetical protein
MRYQNSVVRSQKSGRGHGGWSQWLSGPSDGWPAATAGQAPLRLGRVSPHTVNEVHDTPVQLRCRMV